MEGARRPPMRSRRLTAATLLATHTLLLPVAASPHRFWHESLSQPDRSTDGAAGGGGGGATVSLDIYRAMRASSADRYETEDDDIADLGGVLKYIHTEILTEHLLDPFRSKRKYDIDCIRRQRYKIRNAPDVVGAAGIADFGQFVTFDFGVATNPAQRSTLQRHGNFVGIQAGCFGSGKCDVRFPSTVPYYWFSVGNWCPNLPWGQKGTKERPNQKCMQYADGSGYLQGGLCHNGVDAVHDVPSVEPSGERGCVYSYGRSHIVELDDVVGVRREDCGGRPCADWADFRYHCSNEDLKKQFDASTGDIVQANVCVEYDIHPACEANCRKEECLRLQERGQVVELGLPFWRGRCNPLLNQARMEAFASAFLIDGAQTEHRIANKAITEAGLPCIRPNSRLCRPEGAKGGPYCTRIFSGVCETCYIPGVVGGPQQLPQRSCPIDILKSVDYATDLSYPTCLSRHARDGCCLYTASCDGVSDPQNASLDDDGLALVAARQSTADMVTFLSRALRQLPHAQAWKKDELRLAAYFQWDQTFVKRTLEEAIYQVEAFLEKPPATLLVLPTTTRTSTSTSTRTTSTSSTTTTTSSTKTSTSTNTTTSTRTTSTSTFTSRTSTTTTTPTTLLPTQTSTSSTTPPVVTWSQPQTVRTTPDPPRLDVFAPPSTTGGGAFLGATSAPALSPIVVRGGHGSSKPALGLQTTTSIEPRAMAEEPGKKAPCYEEGVFFEPLDMETALATLEPDAKSCRQRCARVPGCFHFSYFLSDKRCHLQGPDAERRATLDGIVGGPFWCPEDTKKQDFDCMEWGTSYSPSISSFTKVFSISRFPHRKQALLACQKYCAWVDGCAHFILDVPARRCKIAGPAAQAQYPVLEGIAGPPRCSGAAHHGGEEKAVGPILTLRKFEVLGSDFLGMASSRAGAAAIVVGCLLAGLACRSCRRGAIEQSKQTTWPSLPPYASLSRAAAEVALDSPTPGSTTSSMSFLHSVSTARARD